MIVAYLLIAAILLMGFVASFFGDAEFRRRNAIRRSMRRSRLNIGQLAVRGPNRRRS